MFLLVWATLTVFVFELPLTVFELPLSSDDFTINFFIIKQSRRTSWSACVRGGRR